MICSRRMSACPQCCASSRSMCRYTQAAAAGHVGCRAACRPDRGKTSPAGTPRRPRDGLVARSRPCRRRRGRTSRRASAGCRSRRAPDVAAVLGEQRGRPPGRPDPELGRDHAPAVRHQRRRRPDPGALGLGHRDEVEGRRPAPEPHLAAELELPAVSTGTVRRGHDPSRSASGRSRPPPIPVHARSRRTAPPMGCDAREALDLDRRPLTGVRLSVCSGPTRMWLAGPSARKPSGRGLLRLPSGWHAENAAGGAALGKHLPESATERALHEAHQGVQQPAGGRPRGQHGLRPVPRGFRDGWVGMTLSTARCTEDGSVRTHLNVAVRSRERECGRRGTGAAPYRDPRRATPHPATRPARPRAQVPRTPSAHGCAAAGARDRHAPLGCGTSEAPRA